MEELDRVINFCENLKQPGTTALLAMLKEAKAQLFEQLRAKEAQIDAANALSDYYAEQVSRARTNKLLSDIVKEEVKQVMKSPKKTIEG